MPLREIVRSAVSARLRESRLLRSLTSVQDKLRTAYSVVAAPRARARRSGAVVLMYHGVTPAVIDPFVEGGMLSADLFRLQVRHLVSSYRIVALGELIDCIESGKAIPRNWVVLTFDDGYRNNLAVAHQIMREEGRLPMTVFPITDFIGTTKVIPTVMLRMCAMRARIGHLRIPRPDGSWETLPAESRRQRANAFWDLLATFRNLDDVHQRFVLEKFLAQFGEGEPEEIRASFPSFDWLDWDELRTLRSDGVEIGSHTCRHASLGPRLQRDDMRHEIVASRDRIATELGVAPIHFAYPYGTHADFCPLAIELLHEAGYRSALTTMPGTVDGSSAAFTLPRLARCVRDIGSFRLATARGRE